MRDDDGSFEGWSCIPGEKVIINDVDENGFDNETTWTSRHYDYNEGDDRSIISSDLYDPNPLAKSNKYDSESKIEGASGDFGMLYSLEVIDGNSYRVLKTGDETNGFTTKIVSTNKGNAKKRNKYQSDSQDNHKTETTKEAVESIRNELNFEKSRKKSSNPSNVATPEEGKEKDENPDKRGLQKLKLRAKDEVTAAKRKKPKLDENCTSRKKKDDEICKSSKDCAHMMLEQHVQQQQPKTDYLQQEQAIEDLRTRWSIAASGLALHGTLCQGLLSLNYVYPTPIQASTLAAAIFGRRNIVGAAPTGSGKTLSYGLPILQYLLENKDHGDNNDITADHNVDVCCMNGSKKPFRKNASHYLRSLILVPTRELAIQVRNELVRVSCQRIAIGVIVGGFAEAKQRRILEKVRPEVLVCTPGRLWELVSDSNDVFATGKCIDSLQWREISDDDSFKLLLLSELSYVDPYPLHMSSNEYSLIRDYSQLRFLVIDEADRMIKQGSFPQLQQIFEVINKSCHPPVNNTDPIFNHEGKNDKARLTSLDGVRGEAKVVMLDQAILTTIQQNQNRGNPTEPNSLDDEDCYSQDSKDTFVSSPIHRQTFIFSATLTLPPSTHHILKNDSKLAKALGKKKRKGQLSTVDGAIAQILHFAGATGSTKIVDMSSLVLKQTNEEEEKSQPLISIEKNDGSSNKDMKHTISIAARLPPGLKLGEIRCAQRHKDSHLYAFLVATHQGLSGPCLVFCNSIAAVRRVGETLKLLGLPVKMLHAQMAQKSRLRSLESFNTVGHRSVVVASDVASRGLDIPSIATIVHYDVARMVDLFIHRSGRTARGVGENAVGFSLSLVAPAEERQHQKICESVMGNEVKSLERIHVDSRLLSQAQARVSLAAKIVMCNDIELQTSRKNNWLKKAADEVGIEIDEDMLEKGQREGDIREQQRFIEAKRARIELCQLLAQPFRMQHFGKFLSGPGIHDAIKTEEKMAPYVLKESPPARRKNRRRR